MKGLLPWLSEKITDTVVMRRDRARKHPRPLFDLSKTGPTDVLAQKLGDQVIKNRARERNNEQCKALEIIDELHKKSTIEYSYLNNDEHYIRALTLARKYGWNISLRRENTWVVTDSSGEQVTYLSLAMS